MALADLLHDTHVTAIQHGLTEISDEAMLVGVVRRPSNKFLSVVDENYSSLALPATVRDEFEQRYEDFKMRGMCAEGAHNAAWEAEDIDDRYCSYVESNSDAQAAVTQLADRLRTEEELILVCSAETAKTRSHRTLLQGGHVALAGESRMSTLRPPTTMSDELSS